MGTIISLKIMYFIDQSLNLGGAAHTILRQAALMKEAGHHVTIVLSDYSGKTCDVYIDFCHIHGLEVQYMNFYTSNQPEDIDIILILDSYEKIKKIVEKEKPDILHSVQINPTVELVARKLDIPHVMDIYQADFDFFKMKFIDIFPKYHVCDSQYYADIWMRYFHTESVCIRTMAEKADIRKESFSKEEIIRYICVGSVSEKKNQLSVIQAFHKAIKGGIRGQLFIYGYNSGAYAEKCTAYIQKHNLEKYVELKGFYGRMAEVYQNSDVLICGSTNESYPNVISEALANDVIVITTPVAGVPEVIKDKFNGYLCKGYTQDDIYEKIMEVLQDSQSGVIDNIMANVRITYEREHSPKSVTAKLENYYQKLIREYKGKKSINIEALRQTFQGILAIYNENQQFFSDDRAIRQKIWYIYHIRDKVNRQISSHRNFYIWGTGKYGKVVTEIVQVFFPEIQIRGYIDSYKTDEYLGYLIYSPDVVLKEDNVFLVALTNGQWEVIDRLRSEGKEYLEDYFILSPRSW